MTDLIENLAANLVDVLVYAATGLVFILGMMKCVFPVNAHTRRLRRAVHMLENAPDGQERPVWQDPLFLGKKMQNAWRRFLKNAEQLDARGLNCDVRDYVNDETVIYAAGHTQFGDVVPGLLTSLGILGTFIGLMRGLGGLDVSDAAKTMESIPAMIGGMTFAFGTSIVGIACSLVFNILSRMAQGGAVSAIDEFQDAFCDLVMQQPLDEGVQMICQQRDRDALLRRAAGEVTARVSDGVTGAVERSLAPVAQSMGQFIAGQSQTQVEGLAAITQQFIAQMNRSLGGHLMQLGETLASLNRSQTVSFDALQRAMASADRVMDNMNHIQTVTERMMTRFEGYVSSVEGAQKNNDAFLTHGSQVLTGLMTSGEEQAQLLDKLKLQQKETERQMREYAEWSGRVLTAVQKQAGDVSGLGTEMRKSAKALTDSYASFVENIGSGLSRSVGLFDENVNSVLKVLNEKLTDIRTAAALQKDGGLAAELGRLESLMADMNGLLEGLRRDMQAKERV